MNKMTKVMGLVALAGALNMTSISAFAGERHGCKSGMHKQGAHAQCEHRGKMCSKKGNWGQASPEKRQAIMQLKIENRLERMTHVMGLSPEQQTKIRKIMQEGQLKMRDVREQTRAKIDQVLTPEQRKDKVQRAESRGVPHHSH